MDAVGEFEVRCVRLKARLPPQLGCQRENDPGDLGVGGVKGEAIFGCAGSLWRDGIGPLMVGDAGRNPGGCLLFALRRRSLALLLGQLGEETGADFRPDSFHYGNLSFPPFLSLCLKKTPQAPQPA